ADLSPHAFSCFGFRASFVIRHSSFDINMNPPLLLIIEDDDLQYEIYEDALAKYTLLRASSGSEALAKIPQNPPDLIILDHVLAEGELGLDYLPELKELLPHV